MDMQEGILVYCVADQTDSAINGIVGMDGEHHLYAIRHGDLYAMVSDVNLDEYGEDSIAEKSEDIEWLKEKAQIFMDIILEISNNFNVIPMKFLTIFKTEDRVKGIIDDNLGQFHSNLKKIKDREELSVKIYCDNKIFKDKIMSEEIKAFEKTLIGKPKGAAFFLKKKFETSLDEKMQNKICKEANGLADELKPLAVDMKSNKLLAKEITGIEIPMILNCAFLVDLKEKENFVRVVERQKASNEDIGFSIEFSGPWPPYDFCE